MEESKVPKIRVIVRKRPLSTRERSKGEIDCLVQRSPQTIVVRENKIKVDLTKFIEEHNFTFDDVFSESVNNQQLYVTCVQPLVTAAFQGAKVTCFAYGQTGSGKTYTMMGAPDTLGLYALACNDLFTLRDKHFRDYVVTTSFYEIYCGKLHDLLNERALVHAREDAKQQVNIVGLKEKRVDNVQSLMELIELGMASRTTGSTGANDDSSRSHAVMDIVLRQGRNCVGKMSFIDLAGSERGADVRETDKQTRMDGAEINKSLLALKECIRAIDQGGRHTPFRGSKLTQVLKDSFIGNCRTVMIANVGPCASSCEHTLNTLRYADRVKEIRGSKGKPKDLNTILMLPRNESNTKRIEVENTAPTNTWTAPKPQAPQPHPQPLSLEKLGEEHEKLVGKILVEEEDLVGTHRKLIDDMVDLIKVQMGMLNEVDKPGSDVQQYIRDLESVLSQKEMQIANVKRKLKTFKSHLQAEEELSKQFYSLQTDAMDVFDLSSNDEDLLQEFP
jgi:kinesin family protein 2/24